MNNLIQFPIQTMSSKEIADLVDSRHDSVKRSIERLAESGVIQLPPLVEVKNQSSQSVSVYNITKRDSYIVVAQLSPEFTAALVDRWQELESTAAPQHQIPQTMSEALQLAADQAKQLELAAPKVEFVDRMVDRGTLMTATQVAQKHKMSAVKLNRFLDELGGVYSKSVKRSRVFTQSFIDNSRGEMKQSEQGYSQPLFTAAGEVWIFEKLISEGGV